MGHVNFHTKLYYLTLAWTMEVIAIPIDKWGSVHAETDAESECSLRARVNQKMKPKR